MTKATVTPDAERAIDEIAQRYQLSRQAVLAMLFAVDAGGRTMAQFNIPELGGSGQWMRGGMTMVGDMFNNALKARVDALCGELAELLTTTTVFPASPASAAGGFTSANWWPAELGVPSATGAQNEARYAIFPNTRRLALQINGVTRVYDTGEHRIGGVQQQQGSGVGSVAFTSQLGTFAVTTLPELGDQQVHETPVAAPTPQHQSQSQSSPTPPAAAPTPVASPEPQSSADANAIVAAIESLAGLHQRGILSDEEFAAKKAELLARL
ncbi:SHOCT domain-containing protein [Mycobacterium paraterrae]|uniref:SHOCT domain-containing protein n=1 Tax=Mycobacterium paraterrae TaxID=577492 RepID=A0ABY3VDY4_9MYCO|nr:SHOCT domain-containing protein [Mycobacterium paraterrae]UMB67649.1 SHOCT domain-containing protein [Mycobacterium paraterrae]